MNSTADEPFDELIEQSSLGTPGARQLRQRTPQPKTDEVRRIQQQRQHERSHRMLTAEQRLEDRRERLLAAAYTLFAKPGFSSTTIERLCSEARISNRAFYECFGSRQELLQALYERCINEVLAEVSKAIGDASATPEDQFVAGVERYIEFMVADWRRARILHVEAPRAGSELGTSRRQAIRHFAEIFQELLTDLPGNQLQDPYLLSLALNGVLQQIMQEWMEANTPPSTELWVRTVVHIFLGHARTAP